MVGISRLQHIINRKRGQEKLYEVYYKRNHDPKKQRASQTSQVRDNPMRVNTLSRHPNIKRTGAVTLHGGQSTDPGVRRA